MTNEIQIIPPAELMRTATDIAGLCKEFVVRTAISIKGRKFVKVEGWQSIAAAHGCIAEIESVKETQFEGVDGILAHALLRRMSDSSIFGRASAFVGKDENTAKDGGWAARDVYARIAMAQTRAISRACRNAFAYVVVMMDAGLETTPAEEVPPGGFGDDDRKAPPARQEARQFAGASTAMPTPPPDSKRAQQAAARAEGTQELQGLLSKYSFTNGYYGAVLNGIYLWTKEAELGMMLQSCDKNEVVATCSMTKLSSKGSHTAQVFKLVPASMNDDLNMSKPEEEYEAEA